jgi:gas vesicle protein
MKAIGFFAGVGVGLALGLIFAPQSGSETQRYIADQAQRGVDRASAAARNLQTQAGSMAENAIGRASETLEEAKSAYTEGA